MRDLRERDLLILTGRERDSFKIDEKMLNIKRQKMASYECYS